MGTIYGILRAHDKERPHQDEPQDLSTKYNK